ncbi:FG-GAP repeat domain-containing protein [Streptacidiphilus fuscans]|uniref:VCBS repeat-containing protein n=1 Tax=Streptacidiphilus fuscans TaxID=2789292 RepID=A0A931B3K5_9ACTN|nr:VCBS repeat-containing protein [Streptacidiphilus fuscans]MBF9068341.1 VCBS repeat-containing protein [Streptacidiphilus fuscans]
MSLAIAVAALTTATSLSGTVSASADSAPPPSATVKDLMDIAPVDGAPSVGTQGFAAGATGTLFSVSGQSGYSWLDYASGAVTPVTGMPTPASQDDVFPVDGDQVAVWDGTAVHVGNPVTGPWTSWTLPAGTAPVSVHGSEVLTLTPATGAYNLYSFDANGTATAIPLPVLPTGTTAVYMYGGPAGIVSGFVTPDGITHWGVMDWATATYHELRSAANGWNTAVEIVGNDVIVLAPNPAPKSTGMKAYVYPADQVLSGATVVPQSPSAVFPYIVNFRAVGDHLVYLNYQQLTDVPLNGGAPVVLDSHAGAWSYGDSVSLLTTDPAPNDPTQNHYVVRRWTQAADGSLTSSQVYAPAIPQSHISVMWMQSGVLGYSRDWQSYYSTTNVPVTPGPGSAFVTAPASLAPNWEVPSATSGLPAGSLVQVDRFGHTLRTINTGGDCVPADFQLAQHWLYWDCGTNAASGVYDLNTGHSIPLPSGAPGLSRVGDGYLLNQDPSTGNLLLTDFHTGTAAAPVVVGTARLAYGTPAPGASWTVDPTTGYLAYEGASDRTIHVVDPGIPHSPVTVSLTGSSGSTQAALTLDGALSEPIGGWQASLVRKATGQTVARLSGGGAHTSFTGTWNGRLSNGQIAYNGAYTWSVSVLPLGSSTYQPVGTLPVTVYDATVDRHVYNDGAGPDLLAMANSSGGSVWWTTYNGRMYREKTAFCGIPGRTNADLPYRTIIPITHQTANWGNDLLAVGAQGGLYLYSEIQSTVDCPEKDAATLVGTGWGQYTSITSPGDLNGDGHDDLVARDASGTLWFFAGSGGGKFRPRVRLGTGWNMFTHLIGAGDLTGSGSGSLLGIDRYGRMWRYDGNGHGGLKSAVYLGSGFGSYNAVVSIGDWDQNGTYDLLARDTKGVLWFYDGTGHGTFAARKEIGTGFGGYWGLF